MTVQVDAALCIGCGLCAEICPEIFSMGDDMIALVTVSPVPPAFEDKAREAAAACPVEAISLS